MKSLNTTSDSLNQDNSVLNGSVAGLHPQTCVRWQPVPMAPQVNLPPGLHCVWIADLVHLLTQLYGKVGEVTSVLVCCAAWSFAPLQTSKATARLASTSVICVFTCARAPLCLRGPRRHAGAEPSEHG